jgi:hypothetical protein
MWSGLAVLNTTILVFHERQRIYACLSPERPLGLKGVSKQNS